MISTILLNNISIPIQIASYRIIRCREGPPFISHRVPKKSEIWIDFKKTIASIKIIRIFPAIYDKMKGLILQFYSAVFLLLSIAAYGVEDKDARVLEYNDRVELESLQSSKSPLSNCLLAFTKPTISIGDYNPSDYTGKFSSYFLNPFSYFFLEKGTKLCSLNQSYVFKASRTIVFRNIRV